MRGFLTPTVFFSSRFGSKTEEQNIAKLKKSLVTHRSETKTTRTKNRLTTRSKHPFQTARYHLSLHLTKRSTFSWTKPRTSYELLTNSHYALHPSTPHPCMGTRTLTWIHGQCLVVSRQTGLFMGIESQHIINRPRHTEKARLSRFVKKFHSFKLPDSVLLCLR